MPCRQPLDVREQLADLSCQAADLRADLSDAEALLLRCAPLARTTAETLHESLLRLDDRLWQWSQKHSPPSLWCYHVHDSLATDDRIADHELKTGQGAPALLHQYTSLLIASAWNQYRATRIFIHRSLLDLSQAIAESQATLLLDPTNTTAATSAGPNRFREQQEQSLDTIGSMINDIRSSVFAHLAVTIDDPYKIDTGADTRAIRGHCLMWPLFVIVSCNKHLHEFLGYRCYSDQAAEWIKRVLLYTHRVMGIARARGFVRHFYGDD